jgi:hypothetical protein
MQAQPVLHLLLRPSKAWAQLAKTFLLAANEPLHFVVLWVPWLISSTVALAGKLLQLQAFLSQVLLLALVV